MDRPVASDTADTAPSTAADIHGLAERAGRASVFGWAMDASRPGHRLQLELRLGDSVISTGIADRPRPDLEANGIGDGRHAFELPVEPEKLQRLAEFRLFGLAADGSRHRIPMRVPRPAAPPPSAAPSMAAEDVERLKAELAALTRSLKQLPDAKALQGLVAQQAALAGQVRGLAATLDQAVAGMIKPEVLADVTAAQEALKASLDGAGDRIATLEAWMARMEQRVDEMPAGTNTAPAPLPTMDPWQKLLFATLGGALAGALAISLIFRWL